jgi:alkylhydroperoxidase/carboxymuconolactone decarboxylase family protein YurZ
MAQDLNALFRFKDLRFYPLTAMHMIMGARLCIMFGQAGRDPLPDLAVRLRSMDAARRVARLVGSIQELWPDAFLIHRPCCMALSPDETLLGDLAVAAARGDEETAVLMMRDTLPAGASRHLFLEAVAAAAAIQSAQLQPHRREA